MNFHRNFFRMAATLALLVGALTCLSAVAETGVSDTELVVGASVVTSGPLGALGSGIRDGAAAYFDRINRAGGVAGRQIR